MDPILRRAFLVMVPLELAVGFAVWYWSLSEAVAWSGFVLCLVVGSVILYRGLPDDAKRF